jgi:Ca2+-binding RTX toxin-like protein
MILGTPAANTITLGAGGINLESDGTVNVTETNVEGITVEGAAAADTISGAGDGTTGPPIVVPLTLRGLSDADSLTGGNGDDTIAGDAGGDTLNGGAGTTPRTTRRRARG